MKAIKIEIMVVDKVVPNVLVDGGSGLNIMPEHTLKQLGLTLMGRLFSLSIWQIKLRQYR